MTLWRTGRTVRHGFLSILVAALLLCAGASLAQPSAYDHFEEGLDLYKVKRYADAAEAFRRAAELKPNQGKYVDWLGKLLVDHNPDPMGADMDQAIQTLASLAKAGDTWEARYWLAWALYKKRDEDSLSKVLPQLDDDVATMPPKRKAQIELMRKSLEEVRRAIPVTTAPNVSSARPQPDERTGPWLTLLTLACILVLSLGAVIALRWLVFDEPSRGRDYLLLSTFVIVLAVAAAMLDILSGDQLVKVFTSFRPNVGSPVEPGQ